MKILVTGATGFIGKRLARALRAQGHDVYALVRRSSYVADLLGMGVHLVEGDVIDKISLERCAAQRFDALYHCAALVREASWKKLYAANVIGTENVCQLALHLGVRRFIYVSSVAVVSGNKAHLLTEDMPYSATNAYGKTKIEAEKRVLLFRRKGVPTVIIRPPMVYGEAEPHATKTMLFLLKHRLLPVLDGGKTLWHLVYVENLVDALVFALQSPEALNKVCFVADEEALTVLEVFGILSRSINGPDPLCVPRIVTPVLRSIPGLRSTIEFLLKDRTYDTRSIKSLGFRPRFCAREALHSTGQWWKSQRCC